MNSTSRNLINRVLGDDPTLTLGERFVLAVIAGNGMLPDSSLLEHPLMTLTDAAKTVGVCDATFNLMLKQLPPDTPRYLLAQEILPKCWRIPALLIAYFKTMNGTLYRPKPRGHNGGRRPRVHANVSGGCRLVEVGPPLSSRIVCGDENLDDFQSRLRRAEKVSPKVGPRPPEVQPFRQSLAI